MKKWILLCGYFVSLGSVAVSVAASANCGQALPTNNPQFCATFKAVAACYCLSRHLSPRLCYDMESLFQTMTKTQGSLERACANQHDTSVQNCIDDWNCYEHGGTDSQGNICSGTGSRC